MNKSGIFARDFLSLDHMMITQYGELRGKSLVPEISVYNTDSLHMSSVITTATSQIKRYMDKIWIVESISKCKIRVVGETKVWETTPHRRFPEKMFDPTEPGNLDAYHSKDIELSTSAFTTIMRGSDLRIIEVGTIEDSNSRDIYWEFVQPIIQKNISDILTVTISPDVSISLKLEPFIVNFTGMDNSLADYVKVYVNEYDVIEFRGYTTSIYTRNSFDANKVSEYLDHSILFNVHDFNPDMTVITEGQYRFSIHLKEHKEETNRNIRILFMLGAPTIDRITAHYSGYIGSSGLNYIRMTEGSKSGAMVSNG